MSRNGTYQLELFKDSDICKIESDLKKQKKSNDKVRKSLFAKHNELKRMYEELREEHEMFKRHICRGEE